MRFKVSFVIVLLLAILQQSHQATNKSEYTGPNPDGTPGTPPEPPPLKKPPTDTTTPKVDTGATSTAELWVSTHNSFRKKENMPPLVWSDGIYKVLTTFVAGLIKKPQCETQPFAGMKLQRYGQNAATVLGVPQNELVATVVQTWYNEKQFYDPATKNCTNDDLDVCFQFTQLMWKSSQYFACRIGTCPKGSRQVVVCWYIRPGNCNDRDYTKPAADSPCGPYLPPA